jgi:hypothetical protein
MLCLLVCAGQVGRVDAAGRCRLSGCADSGRGLPDSGSPHGPALRTPATAAGTCGHCGSGHAGQPAAEPSTTAAMADRNGTAMCGTGQHARPTVRSASAVIVWDVVVSAVRAGQVGCRVWSVTSWSVWCWLVD